MPAPLPALRHPSLYPLSSIALFYLRRLQAHTENRIQLFSLKNTERGTSFLSLDAPVSLAFKGDPFSFYQRTAPGRDDVFYIIFFLLLHTACCAYYAFALIPLLCDQF
jgi:hypothetical protein